MTDKFCIDCKYYLDKDTLPKKHWIHDRGTGKHLCTRTNEMEVNLVTGESLESYLKCSIERSTPEQCAKEGKYWEPKIPVEDITKELVEKYSTTDYYKSLFQRIKEMLK